MIPRPRARVLPTVLLTLLLAALPGLLPTSGATAGELEASGWWWRPQSGLLGVSAPTPPNVPEEGIAVARDVEPLATAAVRATVGPDETDPVLVLEVADEQNGADAAILACVTDVRWDPARGGPWDARPPADCDTAVAGVRSDDGTTWRFDAAPLATDGLLNVVLVPGPDAPPFQVAFSPLTADSLRTTPASPSAGETPDPDAGGQDDEDAAPAPGDPDTASGGAAAQPPAAPPVPRAAPTAPAPTPAPAPQPEVAPPTGSAAPAPAAGSEEVAAAAPVPGDAGPLGWLLLAAVAVSLTAYAAERLPARLRVGPLGWVAGAQGPGRRGLGRFVAERDAAPRPLR